VGGWVRKEGPHKMPRVRRGLTTTARAAIAAAAATACVAATTAHGLAFSETFDDGTLGGWTASADAKYEGAHDWMAMDGVSTRFDRLD